MDPPFCRYSKAHHTSHKTKTAVPSTIDSSSPTLTLPIRGANTNILRVTDNNYLPNSRLFPRETDPTWAYIPPRPCFTRETHRVRKLADSSTCMTPSRRLHDMSSSTRVDATESCACLAHLSSAILRRTPWCIGEFASHGLHLQIYAHQNGTQTSSFGESCL